MVDMVENLKEVQSVKKGAYYICSESKYNTRKCAFPEQKKRVNAEHAEGDRWSIAEMHNGERSEGACITVVWNTCETKC